MILRLMPDRRVIDDETGQIIAELDPGVSKAAQKSFEDIITGEATKDALTERDEADIEEDIATTLDVTDHLEIICHGLSLQASPPSKEVVAALAYLAKKFDVDMDVQKEIQEGAKDVTRPATAAEVMGAVDFRAKIVVRDSN